MAKLADEFVFLAKVAVQYLHINAIQKKQQLATDIQKWV
jgi:hypothetical protein